MKKLTPILFVDSVEACLPFWMERLKFTKTVDVAGDSGLNFCILQRGAVEVMLQTKSELVQELPALSGSHFECGGISLFIEVEHLDEFVEATQSDEVFMPVRSTFYGMRELGVFAQKLDEDEE